MAIHACGNKWPVNGHICVSVAVDRHLNYIIYQIYMHVRKNINLPLSVEKELLPLPYALSAAFVLKAVLPPSTALREL